MFENIENIKQWLHKFVKDKLNKKRVKSITHNDFFNDFYNTFCF